MEEPLRPSTDGTDDGSSRAVRPSGDGLQLAESSSTADEPPIPNAGSSVLLKSEHDDGARIHHTILDSKDARVEKDAVLPHNDIQFAHTLPVPAVTSILDVNIEDGLQASEVASRIQTYGLNKLESDRGTTWWSILIRQVSNSLTLVLVIAMILSYATLDFIEGGVISAVILLNIVVGFLQDYRAEQTIQSLRALAAPLCNVVRDGGTVCTIQTEGVTLGDVVQLSVGDVVCADIRLTSSTNFATDEALLTGESKPCSKDASRTAKADAPLGDRQNMAYASTIVTRGRAVGVIVAVGMNTEIGKIAMLLRDKKTVASESKLQRFGNRAVSSVKSALGLTGTPSQRKLSAFGLFLFALAVLLAIIVFSAASWDVDDETLIYGICVAVAVIPESLIAVVTIVMAVGSQTMAKGNVIVRKMSALEAIGGVTNICSDKTGTLSQGKMLLRKAWLPSGRTVRVQNEGHSLDPTTGEVLLDGDKIQTSDGSADPELSALLQVAGLCNVSKLHAPSATDQQWSASGEPTEIALQVFAARLGSAREDVERAMSLKASHEHSFDSSVKRMSVLFRSAASAHLETYCYTKGATEVLLPLLSIQDPAVSAEINTQAEAMAVEGLRVLCLARRTIADTDAGRLGDRGFVEQDLAFVGLVGLYDPPRVESAGAIQSCQAAGITVHMLTGDHVQTATTIAREIGIISERVAFSHDTSAIMTASAFDLLTDDELDNLEQLPSVLARCTPTTKVRMLNALHRRGKYCVMTGDGCNDSPALKLADVGVAMGLNGSDVAKQAADMVLTDDNFASIVTAIREGRRLFDNIQKFLLHLLVSNIAQVILLLLGLAFQDHDDVSVFPLSPIEILFANLVTSSFLAIGLGLEKPASDVMLRPPHNLRAGIFTKELIIDKCIYGSFMGCLCLASYAVVIYGNGNGDLGSDCNHSYNDSCDLPYRARGTAYSILTVLLSAMAWEAKHLTRSLFNMYPEEGHGGFSFFSTVRRNRFLFWAVIIGMLTPFAAIYIPVINIVVFRHKSLTWEWGLVAGCLICFVALVESWKMLKRRRLKKKMRRNDESRSTKTELGCEREMRR